MGVEILSPRSDVIFKLFFSDERNIELLTDFLKSVLDIPADDYDEVSITDPHLLREHPSDKLGILDVKLKTKTGKIINIEIQVSPVDGMQERIVYYGAKLITEQLGKSDEYGNIKRVISVVINDYPLIDNGPNYHHRFVLYDAVNKVTFSNVLEINTLELPKLPSASDGTPLWNWLKFLDARTEEELNMIAEKSPQVKQAVVRLIELSADEKARALYEAREKERRDNLSREKGALKEQAFAIAKNLLGIGLSVEQIIAATGLTREEIESLQS